MLINNKKNIIMKRIMLIVVAVMLPLLLVPAMAGKTEKQWLFELNDEGECEVERTFKTKYDNGTDALKAFKKALNKQTFESRSVVEEKAGKSIKYELTKNSKSRYNPFAGNFRESFRFIMEVEYEDGKIKVELEDFILQNEYSGYGKNIKSDSFSGKLAEYEEAKEALKNGAKGKAKKEAEDTIEEINESLNQCQEELDKMFELIQKELGK